MSNDHRDFKTIKRIEKSVALDTFAKELNLKKRYGEGDAEIKLSTVSVNRPGLLLAGFSDYFEGKRIQVLGNAEFYFLANIDVNEKKEALRRLYSNNVPCVIYSNGREPTEISLALAKEYNVPVLISDTSTSDLINDLVNYLNDALAPDCSVHGVLMEISGVGVLITGHSGLGKSETALELVHRGHRLVADDAVIAKRIKNEIIGTSAENIKFFMEVRGIGIIDVRSMFGVGSVINEKEIELVVELEKWTEESAFDRIGIDQRVMNILGIDIPLMKIPVMAGRNLAIVVEVAARNFRLKRLGYDAFEELIKNIGK